MFKTTPHYKTDRILNKLQHRIDSLISLERCIVSHNRSYLGDALLHQKGDDDLLNKTMSLLYTWFPRSNWPQSTKGWNLVLTTSQKGELLELFKEAYGLEGSDSGPAQAQCETTQPPLNVFMHAKINSDLLKESLSDQPIYNLLYGVLDKAVMKIKFINGPIVTLDLGFQVKVPIGWIQDLDVNQRSPDKVLRFIKFYCNDISSLVTFFFEYRHCYTNLVSIPVHHPVVYKKLCKVFDSNISVTVAINSYYIYRKVDEHNDVIYTLSILKVLSISGDKVICRLIHGQSNSLICEVDVEHLFHIGTHLDIEWVKFVDHVADLYDLRMPTKSLEFKIHLNVNQDSIEAGQSLEIIDEISNQGSKDSYDDVFINDQKITQNPLVAQARPYYLNYWNACNLEQNGYRWSPCSDLSELSELSNLSIEMTQFSSAQPLLIRLKQDSKFDWDLVFTASKTKDHAERMVSILHNHSVRPPIVLSELNSTLPAVEISPDMIAKIVALNEVYGFYHNELFIPIGNEALSHFEVLKPSTSDYINLDLVQILICMERFQSDVSEISRILKCAKNESTQINDGNQRLDHKMCEVIFHNNDSTSMNMVRNILQFYFNKTYADAEEIVLKVHNRGHYMIGTYSHDFVTKQLRLIDQLNHFVNVPLEITVKPLEDH